MGGLWPDDPAATGFKVDDVDWSNTASHTLRTMVWGPWRYELWASGGPYLGEMDEEDNRTLEDWRHGNTLKFEYDSVRLWDTLLLNCGGRADLAERLRTLLDRRVQKYFISGQYSFETVSRRRVRLELVPYPMREVWERAGWTTVDAFRPRTRSVLAVRWLMRWLLSERRAFDPTLSVRAEVRSR